MPNSIPQEQNTPKQLERLAAQRYMYSIAKRVLIVQLMLDLASPVLLAVAVAFFPAFGIYAALIAALVVVADFTLEKFQSTKRESAAGVQELFDCELLKLECSDLVQRCIPDTIEIVGAAEKYERYDKGYAKIRNWYSSEVEQLPLYLARLVCQRINCYWDSQLRRKYLDVVWSAFFLLCAIVLIIALANGLTLGNFFVTIAGPLLPAIGWVFREVRGQSEAAQRKDKLREYAEELWTDAIKKHVPPQEVERKSRGLQDRIYDNRCNNPLILDAFYWWLLPRNEAHMNRSAKELVSEAMQSLGGGNSP